MRNSSFVPFSDDSQFPDPAYPAVKHISQDLFDAGAGLLGRHDL